MFGGVCHVVVQAGAKEGEGNEGIWVCLSPKSLEHFYKNKPFSLGKVDCLKMLTLQRCEPNRMFFADTVTKPFILKFSWIKTLLQPQRTFPSQVFLQIKDCSWSLVCLCVYSSGCL